jgi:mannose-1-phosphate guanylyltransferase
MSSDKIRSAMLLAAGYGTRLKPLTDTTPKPLLPLDGCATIDHQLRYLARAGIERVAINVHHLGEMIESHVGDGNRYGLSVNCFQEGEILGTGGGIKNAAAFFGTEHFLSLNADALIDADLSNIIEHHLTSNADATMVLMKIDDGASYTPIELTQDGSVVGFGKGNHFYTGLQIVGPKLIDQLPAAGTKSCLINDGYKPLIDSGARVNSFIHSGYFNDMGTHERYASAKEDVASGKFKLFT